MIQRRDSIHFSFIVYFNQTAEKLLPPKILSTLKSCYCCCFWCLLAFVRGCTFCLLLSVCFVQRIDLPFHTPKSHVIGIHSECLNSKKTKKIVLNDHRFYRWRGWKNFEMSCDNFISDNLWSIFEWTISLKASILSDNLIVLINLFPLRNSFIPNRRVDCMGGEHDATHLTLLELENKVGHIKSFIHNRTKLFSTNQPNAIESKNAILLANTVCFDSAWIFNRVWIVLLDFSVRFFLIFCFVCSKRFSFYFWKIEMLQFSLASTLIGRRAVAWNFDEKSISHLW